MQQRRLVKRFSPSEPPMKMLRSGKAVSITLQQPQPSPQPSTSREHLQTNLYFQEDSENWLLDSLSSGRLSLPRDLDRALPDHQIECMDSELSFYDPSKDQTPVTTIDRLQINEATQDHSQVSIESLDFSGSSTASSVLVFKYIQGTKVTQRKCFICDSIDGRKLVPWQALRQVWFKLNIYIPKTIRVCQLHLDENHVFTAESLEQIEASKQGITVRSYDFGLWLHEVSDLKICSYYSFDNDGVQPEKYHMFFGITKQNFDSLVNYLEEDMKNTSSRSKRNGLAMLMLVLQHNLKQELVADMFGTSQQVVSKTIDTVSTILHEKFVPKYLGYHHIAREDCLARHSIKLTSGVLEQPEDRLFVITNATYTYIEKPCDFTMQRKTFSLHKNRNLLKPMFVVFPDGYILEAAGPYFCDSKNNDAACLKHHYVNSDCLLLLEEDDFFIWDRGYRDAVEEPTANGIQVYMPSLLGKKQARFSCDEANESRKVTISRWVVESVNGRLKNVFPFFKHTIEGSYVPKIMRFVRIVCAILNKSFPPLFSDQDFHEVVIEAAVKTKSDVNPLREEIERLKLTNLTVKWEPATADSVPEFPKLSWDDLRRITLGTYQLKIAARYNEKHLRGDSEYGIYIHRDIDGILRTKISSRYRRSSSHSQLIKYEEEEEGFDAIKGYCCTCKVGERTSGCCSHLAAVLRYLGFDRHQPQREPKKLLPWDALDCEEYAEEEDVED